MNSSARRLPRVFRQDTAGEAIFVIGESSRKGLPEHGAIATATEVVANAERRAAEIVARAGAEAGRLLAEAEAAAASITAAARDEGLADGRSQAEEAISHYVDLARQAAQEGKAVRDDIASQSASVVARAASLGVRRVVGEYYEQDPERTIAACSEALRAVAGQEVVCIRVNSAVEIAVRASLVDAAAYVRPDDGVDIGGCIIDLRHGTLDATLEARLTLMDLALARAGGEDLQ